MYHFIMSMLQVTCHVPILLIAVNTYITYKYLFSANKVMLNKKTYCLIIIYNATIATRMIFFTLLRCFNRNRLKFLLAIESNEHLKAREKGDVISYLFHKNCFLLRRRTFCGNPVVSTCASQSIKCFIGTCKCLRDCIWKINQIKE